MQLERCGKVKDLGVIIDSKLTFEDHITEKINKAYAEAVRKLPNKQCSSDPMPSWLLKECIDDLAPYLSQMFSLSLQSAWFRLPSKLPSSVHV